MIKIKSYITRRPLEFQCLRLFRFVPDRLYSTMKIFLLIMGFTFPQFAFSNCEIFHDVLIKVDGAELTVGTGEIELDKHKYPSCFIKLTGNPNRVKGDWKHSQFDAQKNSELYEAGWRMDFGYTADGGDGGQIGITKGSTFCLISSQWETGWCCGNETGVSPEQHYFRTTVECADIKM